MHKKNSATHAPLARQNEKHFFSDASYTSTTTTTTTTDSASYLSPRPLRHRESRAAVSHAALRYRTDFDKRVIHFMFERLPFAEEVLVPDAEGDERSNTAVGEWHFFWMSVGRIRALFSTAEYRLQDNQIINHFPNHYELTRKDLMYKNIKRYLREHQLSNPNKLTLWTPTDWSGAAVYGSGGVGAPPSAASEASRWKAFHFAEGVPVTYDIPNDMSMFVEEFKRQPGSTWIVKPTSRSQGRGIFLISRVQQLMQWSRDKKEAEAINAAGGFGSPTSSSSASPPPHPAGFAAAPGASSSNHGGGQSLLGSFIVSKYITNPLLVGGKKFDIRLYVLVTSYKPLVAYLHRDGFARFCATRYAGTDFSADQLGSHLTNVALQKGDAHYNKAHGGKCSLENLLLYIESRYGAYAAEGLMANIEFLIFHSLRAVDNVLFNDKHSFELYGYDILVDDDIKPHLIEVNASPSLSTTTLADRLLKEQVLTDMLKIVLPPGFPRNTAVPYWHHRTRTDIATKMQTGFRRLQF